MFLLDKPESDGMPLRDHLLAVEKATGTRPEQLNVKPLPAHVEYLFEWFRALRRGIAGGEFGARAMPWSEILAWSKLYEITLKPWEIDAIRLLDFTYLVALKKE